MDDGPVLGRSTDPLMVRAALREVPGEPDVAQSLRLLNGLVLREWRQGNLTIGRVRGIGWQLYRDEFKRHDLSYWGVVVECEGESLDEGYITEDGMRSIIDRQLAPFADQADRLPPWT